MAKNPKQLGSEAVVVAEGSSSETQELVPAAPLSLYQKLALLRRELKHIDKKGTNSHFNYKYMRAEDVAGDLGDWLAEHNVIMARRNGKTTMSGDYVVFECDYIFVDAETLEEMSVYSMGVDKGDKAAYKAQTGALKYALTQATLMRVGDDPEDEREEVKPPRPSSPPPPPLAQKRADSAVPRPNGYAATIPTASRVTTTPPMKISAAQISKLEAMAFIRHLAKPDGNGRTDFSELNAKLKKEFGYDTVKQVMTDRYPAVETWLLQQELALPAKPKV